jgi:hypothetical protein
LPCETKCFLDLIFWKTILAMRPDVEYAAPAPASALPAPSDDERPRSPQYESSRTLPIQQVPKLRRAGTRQPSPSAKRLWRSSVRPSVYGTRWLAAGTIGLVCEAEAVDAPRWVVGRVLASIRVEAIGDLAQVRSPVLALLKSVCGHAGLHHQPPSRPHGAFGASAVASAGSLRWSRPWGRVGACPPNMAAASHAHLLGERAYLARLPTFFVLLRKLRSLVEGAAEVGADRRRRARLSLIFGSLARELRIAHKGLGRAVSTARGMVVAHSASIARVGHTGSLSRETRPAANSRLAFVFDFLFFAEISIGSGGSAVVQPTRRRGHPARSAGVRA